jgi:glycosyltransferase involved in cell wall biosynthesis
MNVLFLTSNPNLVSTARILQCWLMLGKGDGVQGRVVVQRPGDLAGWLEDNAVPHRVDPMPWPDRRRPLASLRHAWGLARWARGAGVEVIHCNEHDVYPFASLLRRFLRRPIVCHVRFRLSRGFSEWAFGGPGRRPDALLWTSHQQRKDSAPAVEGLVPENRQQVLYLGLDLETFGRMGGGRKQARQAWGIRPDEVVVGTASALKPIKRIEDFIDLVARLAKDDARVVGLLGGDAMPGQEAYRRELLERVEATGLGRRFRWVGHQEPVEPFHHACDVFVSTSEYETFGNSVCEAMACRRPVAAYRGGSVHEVVGDAGLIFETGDLDGLTGAVARLVRDPSLRADLGDRGRRRVAEQFNPADGLRQLKHVYRAVLGERSPASLLQP